MIQRNMRKMPEAILGPNGPPNSARPNIGKYRLMTSRERAVTAHILYTMTLKLRVPAFTTNVLSSLKV